MRRINIQRIIAIVITGFFFGLYRHYYYVRWSTLGKDAFITYQLHRFDTYMAHPRPLVATLILTITVYAIILGFYELVVFALASLIPSGHSTASTMPIIRQP